MTRLGWHWLAELRGADPDTIRDPDRAAAALIALARAAGLRRLGEPLVGGADGGLAAVLLLAESHASVHVPPAGDTAFFDLFSCRGEVDGEACARALSALYAGQVRWWVVERGA